MKVSASIALLAAIGIALFLYLCRTRGVFPFAIFKEMVPEYPWHISNLSISFVLYAVTGYSWIQMGVLFKHIQFLGVAIVLANLIYEIWIPFINTPDIIDAAYGVVGTLLGYVFLTLIRKYGVKQSV